MIVRELLAVVERLAPWGRAARWDSVGLEIGHPRETVQGVVVALEPTESVCAEAAGAGANVVVSHHPLFFRPYKNLVSDLYPARTVTAFVRAGVSLIAAHTNLDVSAHGAGAEIADRLELRDRSPFGEVRTERAVKIVVFTPAAAVARVRSAMSEAGAGLIGNYSECSFSTPGVGTFRGNEAANPAVGRNLVLESAAEERLEMIVPERNVSAVLAAMRASHPYEEVAHDRIPLDNPGERYGYGIVGDLETPLPGEAFLERVREILAIPALRVAGPVSPAVRRVAVLTGSGASLIPEAVAASVDAYVTSDVKYHDAVFARENGLMVVDAGHFGTERPGMERLFAALSPSLAEAGVPAFLARSESDPFSHRGDAQ